VGSSNRPRVRRGEVDVVTLRVELIAIRPTVWRRLQVAARASLLELHTVIQRTLGSDEAPIHAFEIDGVRYADPGEQLTCSTDTAALGSLPLRSGVRLVHEVETEGEPWRHVLTIEDLSPRMVGQRLPVCLAGEGAGPPEEIDGPARYREVLAALDRPYDPRAAELRSWLPHDFDPWFADLTAINARLARLPKHRPAA